MKVTSGSRKEMLENRTAMSDYMTEMWGNRTATLDCTTAM